MITYDKLNQQIHEITEISNVFMYLIEDRRMCDTHIACNMFFEYVKKVKHHLEIEDSYLYSVILTNGDTEAKNVADNFMSGSMEIKRIFKRYQRKWSHPRKCKLLISDYETFKKDTREMFELVLKRIQDEVERLYPLVRSISGDKQKVA